MKQDFTKIPSPETVAYRAVCLLSLIQRAVVEEEIRKARDEGMDLAFLGIKQLFDDSIKMLEKQAKDNLDEIEKARKLAEKWFNPGIFGSKYFQEQKVGSDRNFFIQISSFLSNHIFIGFCFRGKI